MPQGVPTFGKFGARRRKTYLRAIRAGKTKTEAYELAGVSDWLVEQYRKKFPEFVGEEDEAELSGLAERADKAERALQKEAEKGNVRACEVVLYNLRQERWQKSRAAYVDAEQFEAILRNVAAQVIAQRASPTCLPPVSSSDSADGPDSAPPLNGKAH